MKLPSKVELPFEGHPYSTVFYYTAFSLGILQAHKSQEELIPWFCGKYINCLMQLTPGRTKLHIRIEDDKWGVADGVLTRQSMELKPELYAPLGFPYYELIKRMLHRGYYVYGFCNEEYIPGKSSFQRDYFAHDYIIIGYDDTEQYFLSAGYLADGQFQKYKMPYGDFEKAMTSLRDAIWKIHFYQLDEDAKFDFDLSCVISELNDYLHSTAPAPLIHADCPYGLQAIQALQETVCQTMSQDLHLDFRITRALMEHKFFMHMRVKYFFENRYLRDEALVNQAFTVYQTAEKVHMLGLKFIYTKNPALIQTVRTLIDRMLTLEKAYLPQVAAELSNYSAAGGR
ncbi:MAG: hypothetical protein IJW92_05245 [Clostridia bacterium]|nr:hypothetical protein [Clostridia bacterium]